MGDLHYSIHNSANSLLSNIMPVTFCLHVPEGYPQWNMGNDVYLALERGLGAWNEHYSVYAHLKAQMFCLLREDKVRQHSFYDEKKFNN